MDFVHRGKANRDFVFKALPPPAHHYKLRYFFFVLFTHNFPNEQLRRIILRERERERERKVGKIKRV
jgi:hypothetical protein